MVEHMVEPTPSTIAADTAKIAETAKAKFEASMAKNAIETPEPKMVPPEVIWDEGRRQKDAALARDAAKKAKETPAKEEAPARRDDGTFAPKAKAEPAKDQESEASDEDFERAHAALVRSGFRKKELDGMDREEVVKRGLKRARALAADDDAHLVAKQLRGAKPDGTKAGNEEKPAKAALPEPPDKKAILAKLTEKLGLDAEGASTLTETIEQFAQVYGERSAAPLRQKLAEYEAQAAQTMEQTISHLFVKAQAALGDQFPDLLDPDTSATVRETIDGFPKPVVDRLNRIADPAQRYVVAVEHACNLLGLPSVEESGGKSERRSPEAEARRHQRPTVDGRAKNMPVTATEEAYARFTGSLDKHGIQL